MYSTIKQRIQQAERELGAARTQLGNAESGLAKNRSALERERKALERAQRDYDHQKQLEQEGLRMLERFDDGIRKQKALNNSFLGLGTVKTAVAIGKRLTNLMDGPDCKNTRSRIEGSLQEVKNKLRRLADEIRDRQRTRERLRQAIADLERHCNSLRASITELQARLRRLRMQELTGGD